MSLAPPLALIWSEPLHLGAWIRSPGVRPHRDEVGPDGHAVNFGGLEEHPIAPTDLVSHESPVGDPINANAGVSIPGDPRDGNFAPDVVSTPSSTQKNPDSCDDRAGKEHDNRGNQIRGHTGVQGTGCGHESNVSEASHCDANAEHGADGGDPSSPHPSRPMQTLSLVEPSLKALRMHRESTKLPPSMTRVNTRPPDWPLPPDFCA